MNAVELVYQLRGEIRLRKEELQAATKRAWPVGAAVRWIKSGKYPQDGKVVGHIYDGGLRVENFSTGKTLDITAFDIQCAREYGITQEGHDAS